MGITTIDLVTAVNHFAVTAAPYIPMSYTTGPFDFIFSVLERSCQDLSDGTIWVMPNNVYSILIVHIGSQNTLIDGLLDYAAIGAIFIFLDL